MKLTTLAGLFVAAGLAAGAAHADSVRVTQGDATAVLNAFGNGGFAVLGGSPVDTGAPSDGLVSGQVVIRPFAVFNGKHYCALDWHVAAHAIFAGGDMSFTHQDAVDRLGPISTSFWIDGVAIASTRTPVKRSLRPPPPGVVESYYVQHGVILSPSDLGVGAHTLRVQTSDGFNGQVTFHVDATGTGACL